MFVIEPRRRAGLQVQQTCTSGHIVEFRGCDALQQSHPAIAQEQDVIANVLPGVIAHPFRHIVVKVTDQASPDPTGLGQIRHHRLANEPTFRRHAEQRQRALGRDNEQSASSIRLDVDDRRGGRGSVGLFAEHGPGRIGKLHLDWFSTPFTFGKPAGQPRRLGLNVHAVLQCLRVPRCLA